jgi:integrase
LDKRIDTPRLYRLEQLPRALPWPTVIDLLKSLDLTSDIGLRDDAMFLLIATYGLRASEVVDLMLDDIAWKKACSAFTSERRLRHSNCRSPTRWPRP